MIKLRFLLAFAWMVFAFPGFAQVKEADAMIKKIFTVLQQKDADAYTKLFPNAEKTADLILRMFGKDTMDNKELEVLAKELMKEMTDEKLTKEYKEDFNEFITKGEKKGVDWAKTSFISFTADTTKDEEAGIAKLTGKMYFKSGTKDYFINYDDIIWMDNEGWYGVNLNRVDEKSKENEEEIPDMGGFDPPLIMDSIVHLDTLAKPKPVQKQKPAPAKKPVDKPVKTKNSTPANKQD